MYIWWLIFSWDFVNLLPPVHFKECNWEASLILQIVIVIAHFPGRCLSRFLPLRKFFLLLSIPLSTLFWLPLWIFFYFVGYLVHFRTIYYQGLRDYIINPFAVNPHHGNFFPHGFVLLQGMLNNVQYRLFLLFASGILSVLRKTVRGILASNRSV